MDEVFIRIQGVQHYLWRAVDQNRVVFDILVRARRDAQAAKHFFKRLLAGSQNEPWLIVTDKLRSYGVAQRQMQRFKSSRQAQDFLSAHSFIYGHSHPRRHLIPAPAYRKIRLDAFNVWTREMST